MYEKPVDVPLFIPVKHLILLPAIFTSIYHIKVTSFQPGLIIRERAKIGWKMNAPKLDGMMCEVGSHLFAWKLVRFNHCTNGDQFELHGDPANKWEYRIIIMSHY